ncbi:MAG: BPSS1780 family membrane protein [Pseudoxanthomonas sp.]
MPNLNTVPATAGAQWLLDAFALLRRQPLALGLLGLTWGAMAMVVLVGAQLNATFGLALQLALSLLGPFLFAGLLWAVREVDQGRPALPMHLFKGLQLGRAGSLLTTLLPQVAAGLLLGVAFLALIGPEAMQRFGEAAEKMAAAQQAGSPPDPALLNGLPVGGALLCLLLAFALAVAVALMLFVAVPQIIFTGTPGLRALGNSLRASLRNLPAMAVFLLLLFISLLAISFAAQIIALVVQLLLGPSAALLLVNLLMMAVLMPLLAATAYYAWKQMLRDAGDAASPAQAPASHIEV